MFQLALKIDWGLAGLGNVSFHARLSYIGNVN